MTENSHHESSRPAPIVSLLLALTTGLPGCGGGNTGTSGTTAPATGSNASQNTDAGANGASAAGGASLGGGTGGAMTGATAAGGTATGSPGGTAANAGMSEAGGSAAGGAITGGNGSAAAPTGGTSAAGNAAAGAPAGGTAAGGAAGGGSPTGGEADTGGTSTGGLDSAGGAATAGAGLGGASTGGTRATAPGVVKNSESKLAESGLTVVSYGGYLNGESFQQEGITSYHGYQYSAFWNSSRNVVLVRRRLPTTAGGTPGAWEGFDFKDYTLSADDAHNTISLGISPGDGTLHLAFDHHGSDLHYRRSVTGLLDDPTTTNWSASSFSGVTSALVGTTTVKLVTYPRFITEPGGDRMLLSARLGESGSGDEALWEYDSATQTWSSLGEYIEGTDDSVNAYLHGISYTRSGTRLHVAWCWRETPDAQTNHDLVYVYSDDHGRTWKNDAGTTVGRSGSSFIRRDTAGITVWPIGQNRGLINQEHMAADSTGRVHVLLSHMPDGQADDSNFTSSRTKSEYFDYVRETDGTWQRHGLGLKVIENFRGKLAVSDTNNVYAILPDLRIAGASPSDGFESWILLDTRDAGRFFSDPLIDSTRLETSNELTVYFPEKASGNVWALEYALE